MAKRFTLNAAVILVALVAALPLAIGVGACWCVNWLHDRGAFGGGGCGA